MPNLPPLGTQVVGRTPEGRPIILNPDGSFSTERSITEKLPDGRWVNVPTIFKGRQVSPDEAMQIIQMNGLTDPETGRKLDTFPNMETAVEAAKKRSKSLDPIMRKIEAQRRQK